LPPGNYFGLISGPRESHGGYYVWERTYVKSIQRRLIRLGYVPGVQDVDSDWADGIFRQPTKDAVAAWKHEKWAAETTRFGEVWQDDWPACTGRPRTTARYSSRSRPDGRPYVQRVTPHGRW
jgi:N-acetylmuramoyl-L-alanine amidase